MYMYISRTNNDVIQNLAEKNPNLEVSNASVFVRVYIHTTSSRYNLVFDWGIVLVLHIVNSKVIALLIQVLSF